MKAVLISSTNRDLLASRFETALDKEDQLPIGYFLVTDFGNDETFEIISATNFDSLFERTGVDLKNDFFEVRLR